MAKKRITKTKKGSKSKASTKRKPRRRRSCGCMEHHFALLDSHPECRLHRAQIEAHTSYCMEMGEAAFRMGITTIQVVVHVVYRTAAENISDAQVKSQIAILNKDFRAKNSDLSKLPAAFKNLAGDAKIEFKLANEDPEGNATTGIKRTKTTVTSFAHKDNPVKSASTGGVAPWDTKKYLNIWVCTLSGSLLGYAQFPGFPSNTDGVVILNTAFGTKGTARDPFHKGRTAVHEIGHFLNLSHIWGESLIANCSDSDFVSDTPNQLRPNTGKPSFPSVSCGNRPNGDMFMNYMDYVDDAAMFMFTHGQVARMQATLTGPRSGL